MAGPFTKANLFSTCCCVLLFLSFLSNTKPSYAHDEHVLTVTEDGRLLSEYSAAAAASSLSSKAFRLQLNRRQAQDDSAKSLREAIQRSHERVNAFAFRLWGKAGMKATAASDLNETVYAMGFEFLTTMLIGTPPQEMTMIVDTGSDLIWTQCAPCEGCFTQPQPIFNPYNSSTFTELSCKKDKFCDFLAVHGAGSSCDVKSRCAYSYEYGDFSYTNGIVATETFSLPTSAGSLTTFPDLVIGCGRDNGPNDSFANSSGIVGLGQGLVSLNTQLGTVIDHRFSYCLVPWDAPPNVTGTLLFGDDSISTGPGTTSTPLITNTKSNGTFSSFYYAILEGVSVGGERLNISNGTFDILSDGSGGLIVDSGTTITFLEDSGYQLILDAFTSRIKLPINETQDVGLDLCYELPKTTNFTIPTMTFHFKDADLFLPPENYFIVFDGNLCLAMGGNTGFSIMGNIQQQNIQFEYDLKLKKLSMKPTTCEVL